MAKKSLVDYVKTQIKKGYAVSTIRNVLSKYGYTGKEIDEAISSSYKPTIRHEIHLSHTTVLVIVFIFISLLGTAAFFYYSSSSAQKASTKLLDLNLEPVSTSVAPGEEIVFLKELSNLGSSKRYDVVIKQEIIYPKTNKVVTQKIETRAIETFGSTQTKILIPKDAKEGDYILRVIIDYEDKKAVATLPIKVSASAKKESCLDGIKNQNEEGIDCGGVCRPCPTQALDCNDNNPCTEDDVENRACSHKQIVPCCGNNICEAGEDSSSCQIDCKRFGEPSQAGSLDDIKELAKTDANKAMQQCNQQEVPDLKDTCISNIGEAQRNKNYCVQLQSARIKDLCYSNIAKIINDNSICSEISADSRRDSCFMTFVLDNKDYSVCNKLTNTQLMQSCESLRQLNEINQQNQGQAENP